MSSILDALDRADQERRRDPSVSTGKLPERTRHSLNPRGFWILVGVLLLANLILWLLVWRSETPVDLGGGQQTVRASAKPPSRMTTEPPPASAQEAEPQSAVAGPPSASIEEELKRRARPGVRPLLAEAMVSHPPLGAQAPSTSAVDQAASPADIRASQAPDTGSAMPPSIVAQEQLVQSSAPAPVHANPRVTLDGAETMGSTPVASPAASPEPALSEWERVPSIWGVPGSVRSRLAGLKVSVHVYHSEPGKRFVIINKHRYEEDDNLEDAGLKLKRITREGIIIDYGDGEVRM